MKITKKVKCFLRVLFHLLTINERMTTVSKGNGCVAKTRKKKIERERTLFNFLLATQPRNVLDFCFF